MSVLESRPPAVKPAAASVRSTRSVWPGWTAAWLGCLVLGMANGIVRQAAYADQLGDLRAHQVSTVTLLLALGGFLWAVDRLRPTPDARTAIGVGFMLAAATILFEVVFGLYLRPERLTLAQVLHDYDLTAGRVWIAVPLWLAAAPTALRRWRLRRVF